MADEYIKREAVIELLEEKQRAICPVGRCGHGYVYGRDRDEYDAIESDIDTVRNIPAADVRPVVRGQWVHGEYGPYCSNCDGYPPTRKRSGHPGDTEFDYTKFCPNCGADMREAPNDT